MVLIITPETHSEQHVRLEEIYALRARIISHWGWDVPGLSADRDKDQFDHDETVYFADIDEETGQVIGTTRFNPTTRPHLLSDVFPKLCSFGGVPVSPTVWEASRYMVETRNIEDWKMFRSRLRLALALNDYALEQGIVEMSWLTTLELYRRMRHLWETRPLGLPTYFEDDDNTYIAAVSTLSADASDKLLMKLQSFPAAAAEQRPMVQHV